MKIVMIIHHPIAIQKEEITNELKKFSITEIIDRDVDQNKTQCCNQKIAYSDVVDDRVERKNERKKSKRERERSKMMDK